MASPGWPSVLLASSVAVALTLAAAPARAADDAPAAEPTRPFGLRDVEARSSIGLRADYGTIQGKTQFEREFELGQVVLDGELAVGEHLKVFTVVPFGFALVYDHRSFEGFGNVTIGAMIMGGGQTFTAALGGSVSLGGDPESGTAILLHNDAPSYQYSEVRHGFGSLRRQWPRAYVQAQLGYLYYDEGRSTYTTTFDGVEVKAAAGVQLSPGLWLLGEAGGVREIHYKGETTALENDLSAQVGLRGRLAGSPVTWGVGATASSLGEILTMSLGAELRADWRALGL